MCVIIDADVAGRVFAVPCEDDFVPLWEWIEHKRGRIVFGSGGKLGKEWRRLAKAKRRLLQMWRAGQAIQVPAKRIEVEEKAVKKLGSYRSNDPHVIALARASGARILCTNDQHLETDFKNLALVPRPKGKIYKTASHKGLLGHSRICMGRRQ